MEDNKSQNATPTLSVKSKEINDINIYNQKDISPLNTTNDIIPTVRTIYLY